MLNSLQATLYLHRVHNVARKPGSPAIGSFIRDVIDPGRHEALIITPGSADKVALKGHLERVCQAAGVTSEILDYHDVVDLVVSHDDSAALALALADVTLVLYALGIEATAGTPRHRTTREIRRLSSWTGQVWSAIETLITEPVEEPRATTVDPRVQEMRRDYFRRRALQERRAA